jgi:parvulin-like peptidyl-prolyl isomerase
MNMKRIVNLFMFGLFAAAALTAQTDLQPAAIVKLTKSEPITMKQLKSEVALLETAQEKPLTARERRQVLDLMINQRLAIQAAERDKITVSDGEIEQQMSQLRNVLVRQLGRQPTDAEFATAVRNETGLDVPAFRDQLKRQLTVQRYLYEKKRDILQSIAEPSESEILTAYNLNKAQFIRPDTVRFSMIQQAYKSESAPDNPQKAAAKSFIDNLAKEVGASVAKFDEAALRSVKTAGYNSGDAGFLPRTSQAQTIVGPEIMSAVFDLKQGEVSNPIESKTAFQIIKVTEMYEQKSLGLDDIYQLGSKVTVREYITGTVMQQRQQEMIAKASAELTEDLRKGSPFQVFENNIKW